MLRLYRYRGEGYSVHSWTVMYCIATVRYARLLRCIWLQYARYRRIKVNTIHCEDENITPYKSVILAYKRMLWSMYLFIITYKISCVLFGILIKKRYLRNVKGRKVIYSSPILLQGQTLTPQSVLLNVGIKREP